MKRFILNLALFSLVSFIGLQSLHSHPKAAQEPCQICVISTQTLRHLPNASPAISPTFTWLPVQVTSDLKFQAPSQFYTTARAPPAV